MYRDLKQALAGRNLAGKWLSIASDAKAIVDTSGITQTHVTFPAGDWCNLVCHGDNSADVVFSDQVLEHVRYPWKAIDETYRVLRPGGLHICTTCAFNPIHRCPQDYWRFTCDGLRVLHERFQVLHTGSWGSATAIKYLADGGPRELLPANEHLAELNEPNWPIHVWIITQKGTP